MKPLFAMSAAFMSVAPAVASGQRGATGARVEDIFVVRSVRLSRAAPSEYCSERRTALPPATFEDKYDFKAVATRSADGAVIGATGATVGHLHACFSRSSDSVVVWFAQGDLNGIGLTGRGDCRTDGREFPEPGIGTWRCYLNLTQLSAGFSGGQLTTNTIQSRALLGMESDPPGYTQPSIATVRLWRARSARGPANER
jgi:hypothetical protein